MGLTAQATCTVAKTVASLNCRTSPEVPQFFVTHQMSESKICSLTFVPQFSEGPKSNRQSCPVVLWTSLHKLYVFKVLFLQRMKMLYRLPLATSSEVKGDVTLMHAIHGEMQARVCGISQDFKSATPGSYLLLCYFLAAM